VARLCVHRGRRMRLHIKRINLLWYCAGSGRIAFGYDPTQALSEWRKG
jgi:hypothetical protein